MLPADTEQYNEGDDVGNPCRAFIPDNQFKVSKSQNCQVRAVSIPMDDPIPTERDLASVIIKTVR